MLHNRYTTAMAFFVALRIILNLSIEILAIGTRYTGDYRLRHKHDVG